MLLYAEVCSVCSLLQKLSSDLENSTIQQQRQEIQLLTAELKDRDQELNDMVAVHQKQLLAWERDRQKTLTLAERCNLLNSKCVHKDCGLRLLSTSRCLGPSVTVSTTT